MTERWSLWKRNVVDKYKNMSTEDIKEMIAVADLNGDQAINFEEFVRIMLT